MIPDEKFEEERQEIFSMIKDGIHTNIPLKKAQKKYLKNLLYFSVMKATANTTVTKPNFTKLVGRLFKKYIVKIIHGSVKKLPNYNPNETEEFYDENIEVEINNIIANEQLLDLHRIQQSLTPQNIIGQIRTLSEGLNAQEIIKRVMAIRDLNSNHRETPEEARERERRAKEYERQRQFQKTRALTYQRSDRSR